MASEDKSGGLRDKTQMKDEQTKFCAQCKDMEKKKSIDKENSS